MKKLMYLLVAGTMFIFTACNCGAGDAAVTDAVEEVVACANDCQKACCLGCKATEGEASCSLLAAGDHSCCIAKTEANCCCGDATCDGSCHNEDKDVPHTHEGHDHESHEGHDHE